VAGSDNFDIPDDDIAERIPPNSVDVECCVLGAMMRHEAAADRASVRGFLRPEHFYRPAHRTIYSAMCAIGDRDEPIDIATTAAELERNGDLDKCGGRAALVDIADSVFTAANAEAHGRLILEKAILRQLIRLGASASDKAQSSPGDLTEFVESIQQQLTAITLDSQAGMRGISKLSGLTSKASAVIDAAQRGEKVGICGTGLHTLDRKIRALREQDLIIIAARPSMGKTSLACDIILHAAGQGVPCAFFSIESGDVPIVIRMACARAHVSLIRTISGGLTDDEVVRVSDALGQIHTLPIWIDASAQLSNVMFAARAQKLVRGYGVKIIAVDYIQQMDGPAKSENEYREVSAIVNTLKAVANELHVCVIGLSQMNRESDKRSKSQGAELSGMRASGKIEEAADIVIFPEVAWPDEDTQEDQMPPALEAKLRVKKHRNGPKGTCPCLYLPASLTFVNKDMTNADQRT
jgi:replicative DNA helicase